MATKPPRDIPGIAQTLPDDIRKPLERLREAVQILMGQRGDGTYRAFSVGGGSTGSGSSSGGTGGTGGTGGDEPDLTPPPTVEGLAVSAAISHVFVTWDAPTYTQGHGHGQTNIYAVQREPTDPTAPTFGDAPLVYSAIGGLTMAAIPSQPNTRWHIWAKWQSLDGVESTSPAGGTNGEVATTGQDVRQLIDALTHAALTPGTTSYSKLVLRADLFAIAPEVDFAQETAPTSGMVTGNVWFTPSTEVFKRWDGAAWVAYSAAVPFIVQTVPTTINGVLIPAGVYMDSAFIYDLTASIARLGEAWIDSAMVASLNAVHLTAGDGTIGGDLKSTLFNPGSGGTPGDGWIIHPDGTAEFNDITARGTIYAQAAHILGLLTASQINANGLSIYSTAGDIVLNADDASPPWVTADDIVGSGATGGVELVGTPTGTNTRKLRDLVAGNGINLSGATDRVDISAKASELASIRLHSDRSSSSTTMADVTGMLFQLEADSTYVIRGTLRCKSAFTALGLKLGITIPSGQATFSALCPTSTAGASETRYADISTGTSGSVTFSGSPSATDAFLISFEALVNVGSTAGDIRLQLGSESGGSMVQLLAGSSMFCHKVLAETASTTITLGTSGMAGTYWGTSVRLGGGPASSHVEITFKRDGTWSITQTGTGSLALTGTPPTGLWASATDADAGLQWEVQFAGGGLTQFGSGSAGTVNDAPTYMPLTANRSVRTYTSVTGPTRDKFAEETFVISLRRVSDGAVTTFGTVTLQAESTAEN